jgi:hypothetical protein
VALRLRLRLARRGRKVGRCLGLKLLQPRGRHLLDLRTARVRHRRRLSRLLHADLPLLLALPLLPLALPVAERRAQHVHRRRRHRVAVH